MHYAVFSGGQRIRPVVAFRVASMLGTPHPKVARAAACIEILHCASLIVDDLPCMDDAEFRRDRPSAHVAFGESTAVLAAFALVALAARQCIDPAAPVRMRDLEFQKHLLATLDVSSLIAGQALDLDRSAAVVADRRLKMAALKTAPLFELAVRAGCSASRLPAAEERALLDFGLRIGVAFQLADDLEDDELSDPDELELEIRCTRECLAPFGARAACLHHLIDYVYEKPWAKNSSNR